MRLNLQQWSMIQQRLARRAVQSDRDLSLLGHLMRMRKAHTLRIYSAQALVCFAERYSVGVRELMPHTAAPAVRARSLDQIFYNRIGPTSHFLLVYHPLSRLGPLRTLSH